MGLTDEQQERIRVNRERALEIRRRRKLEEPGASCVNNRSGRTGSSGDDGTAGGRDDRETKRRKVSGDGAEKGQIDLAQKADGGEEGLEDFEFNASAYVSKKEAMQVYCLPEGTLAVCSFVEKDNPRHKQWTPMKLYNRAEIRRRARARFGGLEGLVKERSQRAEKRYRKDLEATKNIFK